MSGGSGDQQEAKVIYSPTSTSPALLVQPSRGTRVLQGVKFPLRRVQRGSLAPWLVPRAGDVGACLSHWHEKPREGWDRVKLKHIQPQAGRGARRSSPRAPAADSAGEHHPRSVFIFNIMIHYSAWQNFFSGKHDIRVQLGE